jgi:hypothetical protein
MTLIIICNQKEVFCYKISAVPFVVFCGRITWSCMLYIPDEFSTYLRKGTFIFDNNACVHICVICIRKPNELRKCVLPSLLMRDLRLGLLTTNIN